MNVGQAVKAGDQLLEELKKPEGRSVGGPLKKVSYTHDAMIELIIEKGSGPGGISQKEIAAHFGYTEGWISQVMASDAFQARMAARKDQIVDPALKATIEERFRALAIRSLEVLQQRLALSSVSDTVALRCAELGAKALGIGGHAVPPPAPRPDRYIVLAERLRNLNNPLSQPEKELSSAEVTVLEIK